MFRFHFKEKYLPAEEIVNLSVKEGWGLYHINMDVTSLEETFVNLTQTS
jgi:ABC-2 type transport system ATP-binding protein